MDGDQQETDQVEVLDIFFFKSENCEGYGLETSVLVQS